MTRVLLACLLVGLTQASPIPFGVADLSIAGFTWNGDTAAARRALGAPDSVHAYDTRIDDEDLHLTEWDYRGLALTFAPSGHLRVARITGGRWQSHRGLRVGDTNDRARALYGAPGFENNGNLYYHVAGDPRTRLGLITIGKAGRIAAIIIGVVVNGD